MARRWIEQGETIRLYSTYPDVDTGELVDPISLSCSVRLPNGTTTTISYPSVDYVREALGVYFVRIPGDIVGTHTYVITAQVTPNDRDVRSGKFDVEAV